MKLNSFCIAKKMIIRVETQPTEWEDVFSSCISDKGLITIIYRKLIKLNSQRVNTQLNKWTNELNRQFSKEEVQINI
jgi:hypothetical protein